MTRLPVHEGELVDGIKIGKPITQSRDVGLSGRIVICQTSS